MTKIEWCFLKSHIKRAIYELEVANRLKEKTVDIEIIVQLKVLLEKLEEGEMVW